jgi:hypothetical protein
MSHPLELLVSFEDGTLQPAERAVLDAHLAGCARCAAEVEAATAARAALRATAVPAMPEGSLDGVRTEAARLATAQGSNVRSIEDARGARWQRVASLAGAAAVVVLVASLALPRLGADDVEEPSAGAGATRAADVSRAAEVEVIDRDYDLAGVGELATAYAAPLAVDTASTESVEAAADPEGPVVGVVALDDATRCLRTAFGTLPGDPVRIIRARYLGEPAYLGVFLIGPGADEPPIQSRVLVAAVNDCSVLGSSQADLRE